MKKLTLDLQNCHGIRNLQSTLDFHGKSAISIYAPNGAMKTSFAKTFKDLSLGKESFDGVFPDRATIRVINDETDHAISSKDVVVVLSYDEDLAPTESTSTLLVNQSLRKEYESLQEDLLRCRDELIVAIKSQASTRTDIDRNISRTFTKVDDNLFVALARIEEELDKQKDAPFAEVPYDVIFNDKVRQITGTENFGQALAEYVTRLNELLDKSAFFSRESFSYYNASNVTKNLGENNFFQAKHTLTLKGSNGLDVEVTDAKQLDDLVSNEQKSITDDDVLRKKLEGIRKQLEKNVETRRFYEYMASHAEILPELINVQLFEEKIWKSYLKAREPLYRAVVDQWRNTEKRKAEIEEQAAAESTQWEEVINMFNDRFFVPFRLTAKNRERVVLGSEPVLQLGFEFADDFGRVSVERGDLLEVLSNGEKKALYILNVLFEVEARKKSGRETLFVIDDLADSFDYKNKYAIIQYLNEMTEIPEFKFVLLTHNFDFFRTLEGRSIVFYNNCLTAQKNSDKVELVQALGIRNPFIRDFKPHFFDDPMKRIASIPFTRNILEYTKGDDDPDYLKLTSLLHWKLDTSLITNADLDDIFLNLFGGNGGYSSPTESVMDLVFVQAKVAAGAHDGINFENKIVLSMAIRLLAEQHMASLIANPTYLKTIAENQTHALYKEYLRLNLGRDTQRKVLDLVILMTPANLHVNSFMYEPIIDMADDHLRRLFHEVCALEAVGAD